MIPDHKISAPEDIEAELRPIFEQLLHEFGKEYEIRSRSNFWVNAGITNRANHAVAIVKAKSLVSLRLSLSKTEIQKIRTHLILGNDQDLVLSFDGSWSYANRDSSEE